MPDPSTSLTAAQLSTGLYMQKQAAGGRLLSAALPTAWRWGKKLLPKAVRHSKATAPLRHGAGAMAKEYGRVMSGLGRFGSHRANPTWAGRWNKLKDLGYQSQNWGMLQDDIISVDMLGKATRNPLTWWRAPVRNAAGLAAMGGFMSEDPKAQAAAYAYYGPGWINALELASRGLGRLASPKTPRPNPRVPNPSSTKFNPYLAQNAPRGYR